MQINNVFNYNISRTGAWSAGDSISTDLDSDVICSGTDSCRNLQYIRSAANVYCLGSQSCLSTSSVVIENVGNVWATTYSAAKWATINNVSGNVYCLGGFWSCDASVITNVDGYIFVSGYAALSDATITNVTQVFCNGPYSCSDATMKSVNNIVFSGSDSMDSVNIVSDLSGSGRDSNLMIVTIYTQDSSSSITCSYNDTCIINCEIEDSCQDVTFNCYGNCTITGYYDDSDSDGVYSLFGSAKVCFLVVVIMQLDNFF